MAEERATLHLLRRGLQQHGPSLWRLTLCKEDTSLGLSLAADQKARLPEHIQEILSFCLASLNSVLKMGGWSVWGRRVKADTFIGLLLRLMEVFAKS